MSHGETTHRAYQRRSAALAAGTVVVIAGMVMLYLYYAPAQAGVAQPIPFSHRVHAQDKQISCIFCHTGVDSGERAGVPPLETCMLCHQRILITHPQVAKLREHYYQNKPLHWKRVNELPDYVYFDHSMHIQAGADCGQCHGDVRGMDRIALAHDFQMGFCIQCHRDYGASHDCLTCHR